MKKRMHYRSVDDLSQVILRNIAQIPADVDLVVGIPRSGLLAATMIALYLNRPLTDLQGLSENRLLAKGKRLIPGYGETTMEAARRILVVDDCVSQGTELRRAREYVAALGLSRRSIFLAVFSFPEHPDVADITLEVIPRPMCFQWSFMHTPELASYCLDIDGVICRDATKEEDDDGVRYGRFLREATPLFLPTAKVGWLVTSRLEKYRPQTVEWLDRHGIQYGELVMLNLSNQEARARDGIVAAYKAQTYRESGALLFIESSAGLAAEIAERTNLPVMCMTTNRIIGNPDLDPLLVRAQRIRYQLRRMKRAPRKVWRLLSNKA